MADPTFQIRVEPGHTHPEKRGGGGGGARWVSKKKFLALQSSVWPQNKEGAHAPPGPSPGSTTDNNNSNNNTTTTTNNDDDDLKEAQIFI